MEDISANENALPSPNHLKKRIILKVSHLFRIALRFRHFFSKTTKIEIFLQAKKIEKTIFDELEKKKRKMYKDEINSRSSLSLEEIANSSGPIDSSDTKSLSHISLGSGIRTSIKRPSSSGSSMNCEVVEMSDSEDEDLSTEEDLIKVISFKDPEELEDDGIDLFMDSEYGEDERTEVTRKEDLLNDYKKYNQEKKKSKKVGFSKIVY